jgi:hypothetical protein
VSVYLPNDIIDAFVDKPGVNVSRLCREALQWRLQNEGVEQMTNRGEQLQSLAVLEQKYRAHRKAMESVARQACHLAGISPVSESDVLKMEEHIAKLDARIATLNRERSQLIRRIEVLEDELADLGAAAQAVERMDDPEDASLPYSTVREHLGLDEAPVPDGPCSSNCGNKADTRCKGCNRPLCWTCWTGDTGFGEDPKGLCPECLTVSPEGPQELSSSGGPAPDGGGPSESEESSGGPSSDHPSSSVDQPEPSSSEPSPEASVKSMERSGITEAG